ncbi:hypothetical protein CsatB_027707 [Cannabis sativa]|uniref:uncharacterized protein LOC115724001 n=1 Tax=Cannabis sativa TaxID=3483 RepID=UPI0029CA1A8B|nr:uncharacterized protein LOC115724001 [Cannabis sativa]
MTRCGKVKVWEHMALSRRQKTSLIIGKMLKKLSLRPLFSGLIPGDAAEHWFAPIDGRVKVNVDAALFSNPHQVGIDLVARDSRGFLIEGCTKTFLGNFPVATAEAMGIREALSWIKTRQWMNVDIESDCLTVIQALRSPIEMISMFGQIVKASKDMLKVSNNVFIYFVRRSANMVAHNFARASILYPDCSFSLESVPTDLLPSLVTEMMI